MSAARSAGVAGPWTLQGRVTGDGDRPIAGATVQFKQVETGDHPDRFFDRLAEDFEEPTPAYSLGGESARLEVFEEFRDAGHG